MAQWKVQPIDDIKDKKASWGVYKINVGLYSDHRKKSAAKNAAKREAKSGESIAICGRNGQIQRWITA